MTRFTDGKKTIEITMNTWEYEQYTPDFSADFFSVGSLPYDEEKEAYIVKDTDYLTEQANDWKAGIGDYVDDWEGLPGHTPETRNVEVME